jgi:hypothetical protein
MDSEKQGFARVRQSRLRVNQMNGSAAVLGCFTINSERPHSDAGRALAGRLRFADCDGPASPCAIRGLSNFLRSAVKSVAENAAIAKPSERDRMFCKSPAQLLADFE